MNSFIAATAALVFMSGTAVADVPGVIGFQGFLVDDQNAPIDTTGKDDLKVTFELFDDAQGATPFWLDTYDISVESGVFFTLLGDTSNPVVSTNFNGPSKYLQITIGDTALQPRLQITSVPYALRANVATTADFATEAAKLGSLSASDLVTKSEFGNSGTLINELKTKVSVLEAKIENITGTGACKGKDLCTEGAEGCSDNFSQTWTCEVDGDGCPVKKFENCPGSLKCVSGKCDCKDNDSQVCIQGSSYSQDSCGNTGGLLKQCPNQLCGLSGCINWVRETPLKLNGMNDIFTIKNQLFGVGNNGAIVHYDGTQWRDVSVKTKKNLNAIWGLPTAGPGGFVLYVVGQNGKMLRYQNGSWTTIVTGYYATLHDIGGKKLTNLFAVGDNGTVLRFNGTKWNAENWEPEVTWKNTAFRTVWVEDEFNVWLGGDNSTILALDDQNDWIKQPFENGVTVGTVHDIWGFSTLSVWAATDTGIITVNENKEWKVTFDGSGSDVKLKSIVGVPGGQGTSTNVYAVGDAGKVIKGDGAKWAKETKVEETVGKNVHFRSTWTSPDSPNNGVWAMGLDGTVVYEKSGKWVFPTLSQTVRGIFGVPNKPDQRWVVGQNCLLLRSKGNEWTPDIIKDGPCKGGKGGETLHAVWGTQSGTKVLAVGDNGVILSWNEDDWNAETGPNNNTNRDIWGLSEDVHFLVQDGATYLFNGTIWQHTGGGGGSAGFGTSVKDFHVVNGKNGTVQSFDGSEWSTTTVGTHALRDIWGASSNDIWAVGDSGSVYHYNGNKWTNKSLPEDQFAKHFQTNLNGVWLGGLSPVYVAGQNGWVYTYDSGSWNAEQTVPGTDHFVVYGVNSADVLLGGKGAIFHHAK